jgi:hypothetical protein
MGRLEGVLFSRSRGDESMKNDKAKHCVACGEVALDNDHHCDPKREAKIENARLAHSEMGIERSLSFAQRLNLGFELIRMAR